MLWPMVRILQIAPLNNESILNYIGERVLGLPKEPGPDKHTPFRDLKVGTQSG